MAPSLKSAIISGQKFNFDDLVDIVLLWVQLVHMKFIVLFCFSLHNSDFEHSDGDRGPVSQLNFQTDPVLRLCCTL